MFGNFFGFGNYGTNAVGAPEAQGVDGPIAREKVRQNQQLGRDGDLDALFQSARPKGDNLLNTQALPTVLAHGFQNGVDSIRSFDHIVATNFGGHERDSFANSPAVEKVDANSLGAASKFASEHPAFTGARSTWTSGTHDTINAYSDPYMMAVHGANGFLDGPSQKAIKQSRLGTMGDSVTIGNEENALRQTGYGDSVATESLAVTRDGDETVQMLVRLRNNPGRYQLPNAIHDLLELNDRARDSMVDTPDNLLARIVNPDFVRQRELIMLANEVYSPITKKLLNPDSKADMDLYDHELTQKQELERMNGRNADVGSVALAKQLIYDSREAQVGSASETTLYPTIWGSQFITNTAY